MFKKQVKCIDCGFLGREEGMPFQEYPRTLEQLKLMIDLGRLGEHEVKQPQRNQMAAGNYEDRIKSSYAVFCTRHVWSERDFGKGDLDEIGKALGTELSSCRKCRLFFAYEAGCSPTEHKELQREAKTQRLLIRGMILASAIGAIIGGIIYAVAAAIGD